MRLGRRRAASAATKLSSLYSRWAVCSNAHASVIEDSADDYAVPEMRTSICIQQDLSAIAFPLPHCALPVQGQAKLLLPRLAALALFHI